MRDDIFKPCLIAAAVALTLPQLADAAGLGRLTVHSTLGQPLSAEIELLSVKKNELASLAARVASPDAYQRANLPYNAALTGARLTVEKRPDGQLYLKAITQRVVTEPFVELMVELSWEGGRLSRQYTALLDPPGFGQAADALGPSVLNTATRRETAAPPSDAGAGARGPEPAEAAPVMEAQAGSELPSVRQYGPVKRGETLNSIARVVRYDDATVEQTMVGLHRHNSDAFIRNNMNLLRTGRILQVPQPIYMSSIPQRIAVREIRLQAADWESFRARLAQRAAPVREDQPPPPPSERLEAQASRPANEARDVVRLSRGEVTPAAAKGATAGNASERVRSLEEDAIASKGALVEANERIAQLESTIRDMHRLMEAKGAAAAAAGTQVAQGNTAPDVRLDAPVEVAVATPARRVVKQSAAPAEPSLMEAILGQALYLAAGSGALVLGLGFWLVRRRRAQKEAVDLVEDFEDTPDPFEDLPDAGAGVAEFGDDAPLTAGGVNAPGTPGDHLPGRAAVAGLGAGAALAMNAASEAAQSDSPLYEALTKMRSMGSAPAPLDPAAAEMPASVAAHPAMPAAAEPIAAEARLDPPLSFKDETAPLTAPGLGLDEPAADLPPLPLQARPETAAAHAELPSFSLEEWSTAPAPQAEPVQEASLLPPLEFGAVDFAMPAGVETAADRPETAFSTLSAPAREFEETLKELDLDFAGDARPSGPAHDAQWHEVQQKFDLAKAYEEMGDKNGARDILQEVVNEGDSDQRAHASTLMGALA